MNLFEATTETYVLHYVAMCTRLRLTCGLGFINAWDNKGGVFEKKQDIGR